MTKHRTRLANSRVLLGFQHIESAQTFPGRRGVHARHQPSLPADMLPQVQRMRRV